MSPLISRIDQRGRTRAEARAADHVHALDTDEQNARTAAPAYGTLLAPATRWSISAECGIATASFHKMVLASPDTKAAEADSRR